MVLIQGIHTKSASKLIFIQKVVKIKTIHMFPNKMQSETACEASSFKKWVILEKKNVPLVGSQCCQKKCPQENCAVLICITF